MPEKNKKNKREIKKIEATDEAITGRGGMSLFVRYLSKIEILKILSDSFGYIRKSKKGFPISNIFKQLLCFFYDGTSSHLSYFDELKDDEGYAGVIENCLEEMCSSHQIKRFFYSLSMGCSGKFRKILKELFIWRLKTEEPEVIELFLDTMVMDNSEAKKREGVGKTYKRSYGFQPLQIIWNRKIVDGIFRGGSKHGNCGNTVINMAKSLVKLIRKEYSESVPIILRTDAGFFDQANFEAFNELGIGFIASGKMYNFAKEYIENQKEESLWSSYENSRNIWDYIEFGYRCETWDKFYRAIYTKTRCEDNQLLLDFAGTENLIITNLGINPHILSGIKIEKRKDFLKAEALISSYHQSGTDELCHRGLKDFGFEALPFQKFHRNTMFYYCMVLSYFMFESYKEDILVDILPVRTYATTVRRKILDFGAKIVKTGRQIILKIPRIIMDNLNIELIWLRLQTPRPIFT